MAKIRAVTFFLQPPSWDKGLLAEYMAEAGGRLRDALRSLGIEGSVWSTRLTLPPLPRGADPVAVAQAAQEALDESGASFAAAVSVETGDPRLQRLPEALEYPGIYASVRLASPEHAGLAAEALARVSKKDPGAATRLALDLSGKGLATPYYPMSTNTLGSEGIGLALLYTGELLSGVRTGRLEDEARRVFEWAAEQGRGIAGEIGTAFIGIDVSPSPWMEMSVARVVEALSGVSVGAPGSLSAIRRLNEAVWRAGKGLPLIGFNETMLPVAEDNVLKVRTLEGLRVRDLALLTLGCLAGIDMVVLPWEGGAEALGGLILDQVVVHRLKAMPLGMRVILYEGVRPGDKVELDKFGAVPVSAL